MTTIITKNSSTASSVPVAGDLTKGELAVNVTDKKLYTKDNGGSVVKLVGSLGNQEASAVAITGGAIDGTPIGGTTASTASFTTVSASGNVTLSGGTANGVLYLNGSKVATSGSALTFDGSGKLALGNVAHTSFIPATALTLGNSAANAEIRMGQADTSALISKWVYNATVGSAYGAMETYGQANYIQFGASDFRWQVASSEAMRLTSTGLGIGTSSPAARLHVLDSNSSGTMRLGGATYYGSIQHDASTTGANIYNSQDTGGHLFQNSGSTVLTLNNSGNLGLGLAPSAWSASGAGGPILQIQNGAFFGSTSTTGVLNNAYYNGGFKYISNDYASWYEQIDGKHAWYTAPSGTAGDAITFTQAMTLDASGNLEIGGTFAQGRRLNVDSSVDGYTVSLLQTGAYNSGKLAGTVYAGYYDGSSITDMASIRGGKENTTSGNYGGMLAFYTRSNGGSDTERARIDSSGNFLVGTTSNKGSGITVESVSNTIWTTCTVSDQSALVVQNTNGGAVNLVAFQTGSGFGSGVGSIYYSAGLTVYATTSDYRLKNVIGEVTGSGARIDALEPVEYEWKSSGERTRGFLAHKFQEVYPQSVSGTKDAVDENGNPKYQHMQASTSEVIADLVAEIKSLRARVSQLESN